MNKMDAGVFFSSVHFVCYRSSFSRREEAGDEGWKRVLLTRVISHRNNYLPPRMTRFNILDRLRGFK